MSALIVFGFVEFYSCLLFVCDLFDFIWAIGGYLGFGFDLCLVLMFDLWVRRVL